MELAAGEVFFRATQKVFSTVVVVEVKGVFSLASVVEYAGGRRAFGGVIPVGTPGHVSPGTRRWRRSLICGRFEVFLAVENCYGVRRKKETILRGKVVFDVNTHGSERSGGSGESCGCVGGDDGGVPVLAAFRFSPDGPLDVSVFYRMVVTGSPSPMTYLPKILVFQQDDTPLLRVTNLMGVGAVIVPVFPKGPAILAGVSLGLPGKLLKPGRQWVASVFLVEHQGHVVGTTGVSGGIVDGHSSGHGHVDWFGDGDRYR